MNYLKLAISIVMVTVVPIHAMETSEPGKAIYEYCTFPDCHDQAVEILKDDTVHNIRTSLAPDVKKIDRKSICTKLYTSEAFPKIKALFQAIQKKDKKNTIDSTNNEIVAGNYLDFLIYFQQEDRTAREKVEQEKTNPSTHFLKPMHLIHFEDSKK